MRSWSVRDELVGDRNLGCSPSMRAGGHVTPTQMQIHNQMQLEFPRWRIRSRLSVVKTKDVPHHRGLECSAVLYWEFDSMLGLVGHWFSWTRRGTVESPGAIK
jgi:hypothetical protein